MTEKFYRERRPLAEKFMRCFVQATRTFIDRPDIAEQYVRQSMFKGQITTADPCYNFAYGETEDYTVVITDAQAGPCIPTSTLGTADEVAAYSSPVPVMGISVPSRMPLEGAALTSLYAATKGAVIGGFLGLISSVALTVVSPSVWEATLGNPKGSALFPYTSPALFSMAIGFVGIWLFSVLDNSQRAKVDRAGFLAQQVRSETGIGAAGASAH